jgi:hypothetical protein
MILAALKNQLLWITAERREQEVLAEVNMEDQAALNSREDSLITNDESDKNWQVLR